jgi:hypothetical protein
MADNESITTTKTQLKNKIKTSEKTNTVHKLSIGITLKLVLKKQENPDNSGDKMMMMMMMIIIIIITIIIIKPM